MSALFGALGDRGFVAAVAKAMPVPLASRESDSSGAGPALHVGLAQSAAFFPLDRPVVTPSGAIAALRGYVWDAKGMPTSVAHAEALVGTLADRLLADGHLSVDGTNISGVFSLIVVTPTRIVGTTDPTGIYPLYFLAGRGGIAVSSHGRPLALAGTREIDWPGALQAAAFGYTLGTRTIFAGVMQASAGAAVSLDLAGGLPSIVEQSAAFGAIAPYRSANDAADALWADYQAGLREIARVPGCAGMLMSGGFDTRLVAMGFAASGRPITALTIGDEGNFEAAIAERVASLTHARWRMRTARDDLDRLGDRVRRMVAEAESVNFPTSDRGGEALVADGATTLSTGYGGETVLGGQGTGQFISASRPKRLLSAIVRALPASSRRSLDREAVSGMHRTMVAFHTRALLQLKNRVARPLASGVDQAIAGLDDEIDAELRRVLLSGPATLDQLVERFWAEHHVRKHFGRQELTLDMHAPLLLPTINTALFVRASNIDPRWKTDHGIYLRMVRRHWGPYAAIPTSNIPVALSNPPFVIWGARTVRSLWDRAQTDRQMRTKGTAGRRFGWSNYEIWLRESPLFEQLPAMIDARLIDPAWLQRKLGKQRAWAEKVHSGQEYLTYITLSGMLADLL